MEKRSRTEAKKKQNYRDKPLARRCRECIALESTEIEKSVGWTIKKLKCKVGKFPVKANSLCDVFSRKTEDTGVLKGRASRIHGTVR